MGAEMGPRLRSCRGPEGGTMGFPSGEPSSTLALSWSWGWELGKRQPARDLGFFWGWVYSPSCIPGRGGQGVGGGDG